MSLISQSAAVSHEMCLSVLSLHQQMFITSDIMKLIMSLTHVNII